MYLDAVFSVSPKGVEIMEKMNANRRLDYVLGIDADESFTNYMINISDFKGTINLFFDTLKSSEGNLLELSESNMKELYKDEYFKIYNIISIDVKSLNQKLQLMDLDYMQSNMTIAEYISGKSTISGYEKFLEFQELLEEACKQNANLLLIMRIK